MKRFLAVVVVLLVLGLTASSAVAASTVMPKSSQTSPKTTGCPCCSRNVSLPKDTKVQELRGPTAYFWALEVLGFKDTIKLQEELARFGFTPDFQGIQVQIISSSKGTVKVVEIPLKGNTQAVLVYVKNKFGSATVIATGETSSVVEYYYEQGTLKHVVRPIPTSSASSAPQWGLPGKCTICKLTVHVICKIGYNRAVSWGCGRICALGCVPFDEDPLTGALCMGACYVICKKALGVIGEKTCSVGANEICHAIGACKG